MFSIERVVLNNFRSFIGTHVFEIPEGNGLYNLTGKNLSKPGLGANACGKSSLLDSIYWCFYGRTTRGLKAGDVVPWGHKSAQVSVVVTVSDLKWTISRSQSPNTLTWDGHSTDQATIDKYLRLTPEAFLCSVIMPQFGDAFFDLTPAEKLNLFSAIMELDTWLERSQAADAKAKELDKQRQTCALSLSKAEGQCESIRGDLDALEHKAECFSEEQGVAITGMETELRHLVGGLKKREEEMKACRNVLLRAEEKIAALVAKGICPTCKQITPHADLKDLNRNKADFEDKLHRLQMHQANDKRKQADLQSAIAKEVARVNPYTEMLKDKKAALSKLKEQKTTLKAKAIKLDEDHAATSFWISGFKRIRLLIVEETLRQLELEVNNSLANLGLMDWRIEFDVERENKSGGITKGFSVMIYPPGVDTPIRYEAYSGGETQRLRLAGDLGLANLIMERAGLSNTIEFFDEPSRHLSQEGLTDLAELLAQRAQDQGKRIFLVDHHVVDFAGFAGTLTVTKDGSGSYLP